MTEFEDIDDALLNSFLAGHATDAEHAAVRRWVEAQPGREAELAEYRELWIRSAALPSAARMDAMWESLRTRMHEPEAEAEVKMGAPRGQPGETLRLVPSATRRPWLARRPAATAHLLLAAAMIVLVLWRPRIRQPDARTTAAETVREVRTARGEQVRLQLSDGTQVHLGPESSLHLRYVANGPREARLQGEAVFQVTHDPDRPFRVWTANSLTEDLGTVFGIRSYPGDSDVRVAVTEGTVVLRPVDAENLVVLRPGEVGRLDASGGLTTERAVDADRYLGWVRDHLAYRQIPLRTIADDLERRYNVTIVIPDPATASRRMTLDLQRATLDDVLQAITVPLNIRSERAGPTIILRP